MKYFVTAALVLAIAGGTISAQAPVPKALHEARTVYLTSTGAGRDLLDRLAKDLTKWGRFTLMDSDADADLVFALSVGQGATVMMPLGALMMALPVGSM